MIRFNFKRGFTLVEMLVVVAIFSIMIGTIVSVFISAIRIQRYSLTSQQLLNQTSYASEYMSRLMRMAKKDLDGSCINIKENYEITRVGKGLKFENYNQECQEFFWDTNDNQLKEYIAGRTPEEILPLTSGDFEIKDLKFYISGESQIDDRQPRVTIFLNLKGKGSGSQPEIKIQTTVSQRDLDLVE